MIIGFIVNNPKLWYEHYEWVVNEVATQKVEGIDSTKNDADQAIAAFENFWLFLVDQKINFLQLVFQNKAGQMIPHGQGGWSQSLFHSTEDDLSVDRLQRMLFSQSNRSMIEALSQKFWDDTFMEFGCYSREQFEMLLAFLFCIFNKGDAEDIIRKHVQGFSTLAVFPLWIGSMVCRKWCGDRSGVPVFVFVVGTYIRKRGWTSLLF